MVFHGETEPVTGGDEFSAPESFESCTAAGGAFGPVGGCIRWSILGLVGALSAVVVPFIPAVRALRLLRRLGQSARQHFDLFPIGLVAVVPAVAVPVLAAVAEAVAVGDCNEIARTSSRSE